MAITVNYAPAASTLGQAGFMAGRGEYATDERRYRDKIGLATEELLQNERMQQRQIAATARNNLINQTAAAQRQMLGLQADLVAQRRQQEAREKMAVFDQYAGMRNRYQQAQLQSALGTQEAYQQNWLGAQDDMRRQMMLQNQMEMQQNIAEQEQQEKIQFAQQQALQRQQAIQDDLQRKRAEIEAGIKSGRVPRQAGLNAIAQFENEAASMAAGITWETEFPTGLTPQEEFAQQIQQQTFTKPDGSTWIIDKDGIPRVEQEPPEQETGPSPYEQSVMEQSKVQQDLYNKNLESFNKEISARQEEIRKEVAQRIDELRTMNVNPETGVSKPISAAQSAQIRQQVEAEVGGYWPMPTRPQAPPAMPANPLMYPTPGPTATPPGQMSVPSAAPPAAPPQAAAPQRPPNTAPQNVFDGPMLQDGRPKIDSLYDLTRIEGTPPDLQRDELLAIGSSLVPNTEAGEQALAALNPQQRAVIDRYNSYAGIAASGSDGLDDPKFYESDKERYMAANIVSGAVAMYGTNTDAWPPQVQAELVVPMKVLNETEALLSSGSE